jgi:hypothetical protein
MLLIHCPHCREDREEEEFHYSGEAHIVRPLEPENLIAVEKLVVGILSRATSPLIGCAFGSLLAFFRLAVMHLTVCPGDLIIYFEEIKVFHAGIRLEFDSME